MLTSPGLSSPLQVLADAILLIPTVVLDCSEAESSQKCAPKLGHNANMDEGDLAARHRSRHGTARSAGTMAAHRAVHQESALRWRHPEPC
jgi:hypothetical protein